MQYICKHLIQNFRKHKGLYPLFKTSDLQRHTPTVGPTAGRGGVGPGDLEDIEGDIVDVMLCFLVSLLESAGMCCCALVPLILCCCAALLKFALLLCCFVDFKLAVTDERAVIDEQDLACHLLYTISTISPRSAPSPPLLRT